MAQWQRCLLQQLVNLGSDPGTHTKVRDPTDATKLPPDFCTHGCGTHSPTHTKHKNANKGKGPVIVLNTKICMAEACRRVAGGPS